MKNYFKIAAYYTQNYLFEKHAIPVTRHEQISKKVLEKYLPADAVIVDCGAHNGADSVGLAKIFTGEIHSFEPVPTIFKSLKHATQKYSNIHCYNLALSDANGKQEFYVSEGASDGSSSLLPPLEHLKDHPGTTFENKILVDTLTLDQWAINNGISKVDMLWLDMQGYEWNMLKTSEVILDTVKVIHTEISTKETYLGVSIYQEYRNHLEGKGFEVVIEAIPTGYDMGNVLFVRKDKK